MTASPPGTAIDRDSALAVLSALIAIPSVNPAYDAASPGENAVGDAIGAFCAEFGCQVSVAEVIDGRRNLLVRLPSRDPVRTLMIEAHLDTVGLPTGEVVPRAWFEEGRVYGRGACDVKGGITAALLALAELARGGLDGTDVVLLGAIDEEFEFRGISAHIVAAGQAGAGSGLPDAAVVLEPTDLAVVTEHNGVVRVEILVAGKAAHTSRPAEGRNAIRAALDLVRLLDEWNAAANEARGADEPERVLAVTTIQGGSAINVVPDACRLGIDLRTRPRDDPQRVLADLREFLAGLAGRGIEASVDRILLLDGGMFTAADEALVSAAGRAAVANGLVGEPTRVPYGTDGSKLARVGVPTIVFGPGSIERAHGDNEWVELDDVVTAARVLVGIARELDGS